jgi:hypothetical protein
LRDKAVRRARDRKPQYEGLHSPQLNFVVKQPRYDKPVKPRGPTSADRFMHPPNSLSHRLTPLTQAGLHLSHKRIASTITTWPGS